MSLSLPFPTRVDRRRALERLLDAADRALPPPGPTPTGSSPSGPDPTGAAPEGPSGEPAAPAPPVRRPLFRRGAPAVDVGALAAAAEDLVVRRHRRSAALDPHDPVGGPVPWAGRRPARGPVVVAVLAVVALVLAWPLLRRPPSPEAALPRVGDEAAATADAGPAGPDARPTAAPSPAVLPPAAQPPGAPGPPTARVTVHVAGAVAAPGVVTLADGARVVDAVAAAGGLLPLADSDRVNLAARLSDGARVVVPVVGQAPPAELPVTPAGGPAPVGGDPGGGPGPTGPVDLNRADAGALDALPGVGPATAAAIIAHREANGPFRDVDGLLDVRGIGEARLEALRDLVTV